MKTSKTITVERGIHAGEYYWSPFEEKDEHVVIEIEDGVIGKVQTNMEGGFLSVQPKTELE